MFKPLYDRVLIEKFEAPKTSPSGVIMGTIEDPNGLFEGVVRAVGSGYRTETGFQSLEVAVEDRVLFRKRSAVEVEQEGKVFYLLHEKELLGVIS
jgi:chaperonin GroES